ncbi:MAG: hypothetical protein KDA51_07330 [Planctomycetales bacterium]|nr:hypothetical protein [Planctomycetales bacterium]
MTDPANSAAWQTLVKLWREPAAGLSRTFPATPRKLSLLEGLSDVEVACSSAMAESGRELASRIDGLLEQLELFANISRCPILALAGQLNAGKSSLLASYLSPANRPRVLRGTSNHAGTHRFVLWLPKIWWDDPNLLNVLIGFMTNLFGHAPQRLADDPQLAAAQYNDHDQAVASLHVPLIAYDERLDSLRLGLLDCPDIQTGFVSAMTDSSGIAPDELARARQQQLSRIGRLCSAFVVVSRLNTLHDTALMQILTTLRDSMPGVPRWLAINRIKARYAPGTVFEEARGLVGRFGLDGVYAAYDFRSALASSRIPPPPARMELAGEQHPIFFEISSETRADDSKTTRYLFDLGERLDGGALAEASRRSLVAQLKAQSSSARQWFATNQRQRSEQVSDAWQTVADACYEFMAQRNADGQAIGLRLQASPAIIGQMADSLQRTAPYWMRVSLSIDRTARQFQQAITNSASRFKILQSASQTVLQFTQRFRRGEGAQVVTPQRLADTLRSFDRHDALQGVMPETLLAASETALQRFAQENKTLLDPGELEKWSQQVWREMSWRDKLWKGTQPLAVMFGPLLAVVLIPFDGGGTAVLVFASTKELLAAAGLAALLGPTATGGEALSIVHRETPWRQLSDLFAICCDSLGVPRPTAADAFPSVRCDSALRRLLASQLEMKPSTQPPAVSLWELNPTQLKMLESML